MKYYLIVGEASGDLHASHLMKALLKEDPTAEFRFFGGDLMSAVGGTRVRHYRDLAYMGIIAVLLHLRTILRNMAFCKRDIVEWQPDVVILVDYPGFNLKIAKFVHNNTHIPVYYYISPKIWAWKEYRIKEIKRNVDELFSILPFEVPFFEQKHHYPIHYVGNPTAEEVRQFQATYNVDDATFRRQHGLDERPIIALLAGSRKQEIAGTLPQMIAAAQRFADYSLCLLRHQASNPSSTTHTSAEATCAWCAVRPTPCFLMPTRHSSRVARLRSRQHFSAFRRWCATTPRCPNWWDCCARWC